MHGEDETPIATEAAAAAERVKVRRAARRAALARGENPDESELDRLAREQGTPERPPDWEALHAAIDAEDDLLLLSDLDERPPLEPAFDLLRALSDADLHDFRDCLDVEIAGREARRRAAGGSCRRCPKCNSTDVYQSAWQNVNDGTIGYERPLDVLWCLTCDEALL